MVSEVRKRWKRKSGYVTPNLTVSKKALIENDLFVNPHYSDWDDWRDGMRDWYKDFKKIKKINLGVTWFKEDLYEKRIKMNRKQKKLIKRRKAMKNTERFKYII